MGFTDDKRELYEILDIPGEVQAKLYEYGAGRESDIPNELFRMLLCRSQWVKGVAELKSFLGDDPDGIKILWEQLHIAGEYSYGEYVKRGISQDIFTATMKFCTRFLHEHFRNFGIYKYTQAGWFPRQLSLLEYRVGALEYEFVDGEEREIAVHIPSDANLSKDFVRRSLDNFYAFRSRYFPDWDGIKLTCCSWMMAPALQLLLGENSNIVAFQRLFEIDSVDLDATWFIKWIYPGYLLADETLPEKTTLQRELKKYLLAGNKFGVAKGHIK